MKKFLVEQVECCKWQDSILKKIENKLYEMKELAEYARDYELLPCERERLKEQLNRLKQEVHSIEQQLQFEVN
ncbi:hypothetical protein [Lysinibacillus endophyticus]|uniref:hypothetical protein n=1 Tax=Ureibacillus endophyticus TaxID=1978490 RepID=UPI0020A0BD84|nr:hypothetical protein [Lysinibacillus endophyticus]MCP1143751.1 hypothetical protein [Lysinibacillus endophyticus]